jgi:very-short-patch-repair endonuclease
MMKSGLEIQLANAIVNAGLPQPKRERRFHPIRRWRFDFSWPKYMLAVEVEGGVYSGGRHVRGKGYEQDCIKYNEACLLGWRVLRVTRKMIENGQAIDYLSRALSNDPAQMPGWY